jgi:predicted nuclease of predicted toxin-antitoxin system
VHVREVGLRDADDVIIWEYAKAHGLALVSKDSDFSSEVYSRVRRQNLSG